MKRLMQFFGKATRVDSYKTYYGFTPVGVKNYDGKKRGNKRGINSVKVKRFREKNNSISWLGGGQGGWLFGLEKVKNPSIYKRRLKYKK